MQSLTPDASRAATPGGAILLTGATGFVGVELLARFIERTDRPIYALVRARDDRAAAERLRRTVESVLGRPADDRVRGVAGEVVA